MLSSRLFRVQLELQTHRAWLQSFRHSITAVATGPSQRPARAQFLTTSTKRPDHRNDGAVPQSNPRIIRIRARARSAILSSRALPKRQLPDALSERFHIALDNADYRVAVDCYNALDPARKQSLDTTDIIKLLRLISDKTQEQRRLRPELRNPDVLEHAFAAAQTLAQDVQKRLLPNAKGAYSALIILFLSTEQPDAGNRLWKWLRAQEDNELVSFSVYASAIALLAAQNTSLAELEALYQEALERFSEGFPSYHFSPSAVVPDREGKFSTGPPTQLLLQSIMLARAQRGDSRNAYLALDTLLRLDPIVHSKSLNGFIEARPLSEAWTMFMLGCRSGIKLPQRELRTFVTTLKSPVDTSSTEQAFWALRAIFTATYVFVGSGGELTRNLVNEILIYVTQFTRFPGVDALPDDERRQIAKAVQDVLRKAITLFSRFGIPPSVPVFNSIITNVAGFGGLKPVIGTVWEDLKILGLEPTMVTYRSIMTAAGMLKDADLIKTSWSSLVHARAAQDQYPDATDTHILAKACLLAELPELVIAALAEMPHLTEEEKERVLERLEEGVPEPSSAASPTFTNDFLRQIESLKQDLVQFETLTKEYPTILDLSTSFASLPMSLVPPPADVQLPEHEMRKLYDEMTTDPTSPPPAASPDLSFQVKRSTSRTKIPYGTLRYENWKTLNNVLSLAECNDQAYNEEVDRAIAAGTSPPGRLEAGAVLKDHERLKVGLSEFVDGGEGAVDGEISEEEVEKRRARIIALRTPTNARG